jgi:hypothetical protein
MLVAPDAALVSVPEALRRFGRGDVRLSSAAMTSGGITAFDPA